ncbi:MAG: HEAT repeat domain-containing protein [Phycisphaeraceae bacterium]|nr:HEAT repeat domain-containing protein [Phycisphaeraceae bacterium]
MPDRHAKVVLLVHAAAAALALFACETPDELRGATSLIQVAQPISPEQAARMAIDPYEADNRYRGTMLLANSWFGGEPIYVELYADHLDDDDANVRVAAVRAIGIHGSPDHVPKVVALLSDPDDRVRLEAARTLQRLHNPVAVGPLIDHIREPEPTRGVFDGEADARVRAEAAHALGQYADPRVLQPLIAALDDRNLAVNTAALHSLRTLTGEDHGFDRRAWLTWFNQTSSPFAGRTAYVYPVFNRDRTLIEFLPFVPPPPNEPQSTPVGMRPVEAR